MQLQCPLYPHLAEAYFPLPGGDKDENRSFLNVNLPSSKICCILIERNHLQEHRFERKAHFTPAYSYLVDRFAIIGTCLIIFLAVCRRYFRDGI
jgi:hypothetical protein